MQRLDCASKFTLSLLAVGLRIHNLLNNVGADLTLCLISFSPGLLIIPGMQPC